MEKGRKSYPTSFTEDNSDKDCFDPLGSYTGKSKDNELPVQDADDL